MRNQTPIYGELTRIDLCDMEIACLSLMNKYKRAKDDPTRGEFTRELDERSYKKWEALHTKIKHSIEICDVVLDLTENWNMVEIPENQH